MQHCPPLVIPPVEQTGLHRFHEDVDTPGRVPLAGVDAVSQGTVAAFAVAQTLREK